MVCVVNPPGLQITSASVGLVIASIVSAKPAQNSGFMKLNETEPKGANVIVLLVGHPLTVAFIVQFPDAAVTVVVWAVPLAKPLQAYELAPAIDAVSVTGTPGQYVVGL